MTPDRIKAFLDDVARASVRHGIQLGHTYDGVTLVPLEADFEGYGAEKEETFEDHGLPLSLGHYADEIHSIDFTQLSAHERLAIHGKQSRDLARMLREAFMAGVEATRGAYVGPFEWDADEYAAKIMGGQR